MTALRVLPLLWLLSWLLPPSPTAAHSQMTQPQSTSPRACRVGGQPRFGIRNCRGPCDLRPIRERPRRANFWSPRHPAATYYRGQRVTIKYSRNNHAPGGFVRLTLVPPDRIMNKRAHHNNAFHYSCWGAHAAVAKRSELRLARFGFSMVGSDGRQHRFAKGYYHVQVTIPTVVPDGNYVLGWTWYGGTGGRLRTVARPQYPKSVGYFGDYYSCAFVRIKGGRFTNTFRPRFINDMSQFSNKGCMASADEPGVCAREPCIKNAWFRAPKPFANGRLPPPLTPHLFRAAAPPPNGKPKLTPYWRRVLGACKCLAYARKCTLRLVRDTNWSCRPWTPAHRQPRTCKTMCCSMCARLRQVRDMCWANNVRSVCGY